jgi:pimeloyl-ACP methyl ester carboxylesterase
MTETTTPATRTGYAPVNGLEMYYEIHGVAADGQPPLVLLHGAFSAIPTSFGLLLPGLAAKGQVIGTELQAHGRTADIDRPLRIETLADDVAALLDHLELPQANVLGYSTGAIVALHLALRHRASVRKLVLISGSYRLDGVHAGLMDNMAEMRPEMLHGSPFHDEYLELAPRPEDFNLLFDKKQDMDQHITDLTADQVRSIAARSPALIIIGDSDLTRPEHAVEMFRLFGGGVFGDMVGMPASQLAIIPGAGHVTVVHQADLLVPAIMRFLAAPIPSAG